MAEPTITITPSFGRVLSFDERVTDQVINVKSTLIENTQSVVVSFAGFTFTEKMNDNSAVVGIASTFFDNLVDAETYTISASVTNIFSETAEGPFDSYDFTVLPSDEGSGGDPVGGGSSLSIQDEGIPIGIVTTINFVGGGITASVTDQVAEVVVAEVVVGGSSSLSIQDEGIPIGIVTTINFVGEGVTSSVTDQVVEVVIDSVGGGSSMFIQHQDEPLGIVTTMNFTGTGLTVVVVNEIAEIIVDEYDEHFDGGFFTDPPSADDNDPPSAGFGPGNTILIEYEDQPVGFVSSINFIGAGVSALVSNFAGDVTIDGDFDGGSY